MWIPYMMSLRRAVTLPESLSKGVVVGGSTWVGKDEGEGDSRRRQ